jgi:hypothetical protein
MRVMLQRTTIHLNLAGRLEATTKAVTNLVVTRKLLPERFPSLSMQL